MGFIAAVGKINVYGFRFRRGGDMKTHKLWAWMVLLASIAFVLQFSSRCYGAGFMTIRISRRILRTAWRG